MPRRPQPPPSGPSRVVTPPEPNDPSVPNRVVSVTLAPGERVQWIRSSTPDGREYVSGYTILPAWRSPPPPERR